MPYKKGGRLIGGYPSQRQKRRPVIATKKPKRTGANVSGTSPLAIPDTSNNPK